MSKKPAIVYGRKKLATQSLPVTEVPSSLVNEEPLAPAKNRQTRVSSLKKDVAENSANNVQLFSDSLGDRSESSGNPVVKPKKGVSKAKPKAKKEPVKKTSKSTGKGAKQPKKYDENTAPWAKSTVDFKEYEDYSLAVTMEKSKLDALPTLPDQVPVVRVEEEPEPLLKIKREGSMPMEPTEPQQRFASTPASSLKTHCPELLLDSAKASPVVLQAMEDEVGDDIEQVGNAKLPTPKMPLHRYPLRSSSVRQVTNSSLSMPNLSRAESRRGKTLLSMQETPGSRKEDKSKSIHLQKSVRFVEEISQKSDPGTPKVEKDWRVPSIIEGSGRSVNSFLSMSGIDNSMKSLAIDLPVVENEQVVGISEVMTDSLQLLSAFSLGPSLSVLPEEITAPVFETMNETPKETKPRLAKLSPIVPVGKGFENSLETSNIQQNLSGESEIGDVVGDLMIPVVKNNRFQPRVSVPVAMNNTSRVADISMRRKSLLVHEVSFDQPGDQNTFDDPENFTKSRLAILTPVKNRRSNLQLSPLEKLLRACGQGEVLQFEDFFNASERKTCTKIGEGVSGEVFKISGSTSRVIKVIPVNGIITFNDAEQKSFSDILAEVVVSRKTTAFSKAATLLQERTPSRRTRSLKSKERKSWEDNENARNASPNFIAVNRVCVVQGYFPPFLVKLWEKFLQTKGSENDHPSRFDQSQHYLIFDSVFGGEPLENFKFTTAFQALAIFAQVAVSLAVGEAASSFEHRDLHWGNILVHPAEHEKLEYRIGSKRVALASSGLEVSIIDFTLSRCSEDGVVVFTNLSQDEGIFMGEGDFQFEVYRLMRKECNDNWAAYVPRTNCFWLRYLLDKLLNRVVYKVPKSANSQHNDALKVLNELFFSVQDAKSATQFVYDNLIPVAANLLEIDD